MKQPAEGVYIMLISVHGLVRGHAMELGRDADTGGQVKYVVELAEALAAHARVARVDLLTRQISDPKVDESYAAPEEQLADKARIVRIPCGRAATCARKCCGLISIILPTMPCCTSAGSAGYRTSYTAITLMPAMSAGDWPPCSAFL